MSTLCILPYFPDRKCFALHVAVIRGTFRTTSTSDRRFQRNRQTRGNLVHNCGRRSCEISILIRKTATAARIVGWNRRRSYAVVPGRRREPKDPSSLLGHSASLMIESPHLELNGAKLIAVIMTPPWIPPVNTKTTMRHGEFMHQISIDAHIYIVLLCTQCFHVPCQKIANFTGFNFFFFNIMENI